jgi:hypothetical protein
LHGFKNHLGLAVLDQLIENVVCKWYHFVNGQIGRFCDLFLSRQPLIKYKKGIPKKLNEFKYNGPVILSFTCGGFDIGLSDVLRGIQLPGPCQWATIEVLLLPLTKKTIHPILEFPFESALKPKANATWMKELWRSL